jgi:hypothetical protein
MAASAEVGMASLEARSASSWQGRRFAGRQALSGRRAQREARACVEVAGAVATTVAAMRARFGSFGRQSHPDRHQAALDERQAGPERQEKRQEQRSEPMLRRQAHGWYYGAPRVRQQGSAPASPPVLSMTLDHVGQPT